ncbi:prephenate dehydratase [Powellomyces hirtus]|uniref:prephenate dehydratase n=1 Tax=Powellomyces hirtus TaxID=109895 RepID=A0A507E0L6_9FUNG|nr:prephenate dehydratase [Powellomyces hirtus]
MSQPTADTTIKVAFQGTKGAYSEGAVIELFSSQKTWAGLDVVPQGYDSFKQVFEAVQDDIVNYALVPIENSSTGTFHFTHDLLLHYSLYIVGEYQYHENHCLAALPGVKLETLTEIQSHAYVIDQCRGYLGTLPPTITINQGHDTASSAARIQSQNLTTSAAICGSRAARLYGLDILASGIEDDSNTVTRYILISRTPIKPERHLEPRTSISVWLKNQKGMFHKAAACFALRDINICKIESRPSTRAITISKPWEYVMYMDVDGSATEPQMINAVRNLEEFATRVRVLGSYPRYQPMQQNPGTPIGIGM